MQNWTDFPASRLSLLMGGLLSPVFLPQGRPSASPLLAVSVVCSLLWTPWPSFSKRMMFIGGNLPALASWGSNSMRQRKTRLFLLLRSLEPFRSRSLFCRVRHLPRPCQTEMRSLVAHICPIREIFLTPRSASRD